VATDRSGSKDSLRSPREYPARPLVGVGVVVFRDDTVLLIRRGKPPRMGEWSLPGGAQKIGETVRETAAREVFEETGVTITALRFLEVIDSITRDSAGRVQFHYTLIDFLAEWQCGDLLVAGDAGHAEWIPFAQLDEIPLWSKTVEVIRKAEGLRRPNA